MPVIYELRGKPATYTQLGLNLYSGCTVGCRYCYEVWLPPMTLEKWTNDARPRRNILFGSARREEDAGRPARDRRLPGAEPYQSDEAARLTRKALLILEQYRLRIKSRRCAACGAWRISTSWRNRWKYATAFLFQSEKLREEWEPGGAPNRRAGPGTSRRPCGGNLH